MAIGRPRITSYGDSFGKYGGNNLNDYTISGDIDTTKLNRGNIQDVVEFNKFEKNLHDFVLARLGHPIVRVELSPFEIKTAMDEAITKLSYHAPLQNRQYAVFGASAGINVYEIPTYILNNLEYVVYKKSLLSIQAQAGTLEFDFFIKYFQDNHLFSDFSVGEFFLLQQHLEEMRKILSQEGSWDVINNKYLQLHPTPVTTPQHVILEYRALNEETMEPMYMNWIQRYTLAVCKGILGEIRSKFQVLPSPAGGAALNGEALKAESAQELEKLDIELFEQIEEPPFFTAF